MNDQNDDKPREPATLHDVVKLANAVAKCMLEAMHEEKLSSRGAMVAACVGVKAFSQATVQVEGWTEAQRDKYLRQAIAEALKVDVEAVVVNAAQY